MDNFLTKLLAGLGFKGPMLADAYNNFKDWSMQVRNIESDNDPIRTPGIEGNTAKGVYQFTDDSVKTAKKRLKNMGHDKSFVNSISNNPQEWSDNQADAMFFGNIFAQKGSDPLLKEIGLGNQKARRDTYYKFHHTNPDDVTKERTEEFIPSDNDLMDETMENYNQIGTAFSER